MPPLPYSGSKGHHAPPQIAHVSLLPPSIVRLAGILAASLQGLKSADIFLGRRRHAGGSNAFGAAGISTGLSTTVTPADNGKKSATQDQDKNAASRFLPGDEVYVVVQASGWTPSGTNVFAGLEIED